MPINRDTFFSPVMIFITYIIGACVCILVFRLIFPGEMAPLPIFAKDWRLIRSLLDIFALFPALAFSALVIPFGIVPTGENRYSSRFTKHLFQHLMTPLIIAISAAAFYACLFFLLLPLVENKEKNMRYEGELYHLAKERAQVHAKAGEWLTASQFIGICDSVWENSPELADLRVELGIYLEESQFQTSNLLPVTARSARDLGTAAISALPGQRQPVDAAEAIALGERALSEERLFDAHWLATLGERIAKTDSPEKKIATRLAAQAWNQIEKHQPSRTETRVHSVYRLKRSGYEAMVSSDWIRAYYIFKELLTLTPNDPDAHNFFAASEKGAKEIAFFIDEIEVSLGNTFTGVMFSLPNQSKGKGRSVMRVSSFSSFPDYAYGIGIEYIMFDSQARPVLSLQAPYAKFLPITLNDQPKVLVLMRSLDRHDPAGRLEPEWNAQDISLYQPVTAQVTLDVSYETFLMLSEMRQGLPSLDMHTLFAAAEIAGETGYIPEVFQAEILNRLGGCLFFLPMAVFIIIIGWCLRAKRHPRYLITLLLPVLPLLFNAVTYVYRSVLNTIGTSLLLAMGFSAALAVFIVILVFSFVISLILLAAQRD